MRIHCRWSCSSFLSSDAAAAVAGWIDANPALTWSRIPSHDPFDASKAVLPVMLQRRYGRVLHIASIAGKEGNAGRRRCGVLKRPPDERH
jgi:NAD(P)-dependent dehydrogenase (short-subunit alcohol dehydrogenase family)